MRREIINKSIIDEFFNLSPYEFTLVGNIVAYIIALSLTNAQQNSFGNLLELIAQVLLTIQAQANTTDVNIEQSDLDELIHMLQTNSTNKQNIINLLNKIKKNT